MKTDTKTPAPGSMTRFSANSLTWRILLTLALLGVFLAVLIFISLRSGIVPAFRTLEAEESRTTITRLEQAIESQFEMLDLFNTGYSSWDEAYESIQRPDTFDEFARKNLIYPNFWDEVDISMMLFLDREGGVVWGATINPADRMSVMPLEEFTEPLLESNLNLALPGSKRSLQGFFGTPHGLMLVSARPILRTDDSGPRMGTFAVGRLLTYELIAKLSKAASTQVEFFPVGQPDLPEDIQEAVSLLTGSPTSSLTVHSADMTYNRKLISDVGGNPLALVEVSRERFIGRIGAQSINMTMAVMAMVIVMIVLITWLSLGKLVVKPIASLIDQIMKIRRTGDLSILPSTREKGEIGILTNEFGRLLGELDVAYSELTEARDEAVQVADAKSKFMATMSHEIRTPMNGVLGMTEILRGTSLDSKQQAMVQKIQDSGIHLLAVINDILDFSKIESQKLKLVSEEFNLRNLLEENLDMMAVQASMKNLELLKSFAVSLDRRFIGDPNRINQIMVNLVGNAIKFTEQGQVVVKAEISERESGPAMLRVEVADTGIGISTEQQSDIFKEFSQADDSLARPYQGTGLGLAICNALLGLMGGEIGLESELGKGSCFRFELPLQEAEVPRLTTKDRNSLGDLRVLVLCNEGPGFADICRELENCGMTYTVQDKPSDPVAILKSAAESGSDFDLALLDWDMSGSDGLQAARKIREEDQFTGLPIALIGWPEDGEQRLISSDVYIDSYLIKPVSRASLRACLLDLSGKLQKRPAPADSVTVEPETEKIQAEVLLVEDNRVNQQVGKTLLEENGCRVTIAENGAVALDILQEQQFDLVFMDCHMPEMDGFEATTEIRSREAATQAHIPIVALTADVVEGVREKCLDAGMDDYLTKPFSALQLREVLKSWLS